MSATLRPELERLVEGLEERRRTLLADLRSLESDQLEFRPHPGAWCLLQVAHHLLMVEEAALRFRPEPDATGRPVRRSWRERLGRIVVWVVMATGIRVRVPVRGLSPEPVPLAETAERWEEVRIQLRQRLTDSTRGEARAPFLRHPVSGPLNAEEALRFYVRHFDHHLRQVRRIKRAAGYPGSTTGPRG